MVCRRKHACMPHREQGRLLADEGHLLAQPSQIELTHIHAINQDLHREGPGQEMETLMCCSQVLMRHFHGKWQVLGQADLSREWVIESLDQADNTGPAAPHHIAVQTLQSSLLILHIFPAKTQGASVDYLHVNAAKVLHLVGLDIAVIWCCIADLPISITSHSQTARREAGR